MGADHRPSRRQRWIARAWASALLVLAVGSCTSVLNLDEYANVAQEMCSLLDHCYESNQNLTCVSNLEGHLNQATSPVRAEWLASFTGYDCLDSCSATRRCLDTAPLCAYAGPCAADEDCCGSLSGHAACTEGVCCATRGSSCTSDASCCNGAGACDPVEHTCGGTHCAEASEQCKLDVDCCSKICNHGVCSLTTCNKNLFECLVDEDCCSTFCDPTTHRCDALPTCAKLDEECTVDTDCCLGRSCKIPSGAIKGTCSDEVCFTGLVDCSDDGQCCSGRCDRTGFFCVPACLKEGADCDQGQCCAGQCTGGTCAGECSTGFCNEASDCCTHSCTAHACAAACNPVTNHDLCTTGGPIAVSPENEACLEATCKVDEYCCCGAWDEVCIAITQTLSAECLGICG